QLDELKKVRGTVDLFDILTNIDVSMLGDKEKKVVLDLLMGENKSGQSTVQRIETLEKKGGRSVDSMIEGDYNESFVYDANGEVTKHTATGAIAFETVY